MAKNRMVNTHFWDDSWVGTLSPPEKLLFLYLITNPATNIIGVYEIRLARIALDTGLEDTMVDRILQKFQASGRVTYMEGWMIVHNFEKHQSLLGERLEKAKKSLTDLLPNRVSKAYQYPNNSLFSQASISKLESKSKKEGATSKNTDLGPLIEHIAETYKSAINGRAQLTSGARAKIKHRLATYGTPALEKAINNFSKDTWQMKHNAHRGMAWFFHTDDRIEQYINLETKRKVEL